MGNTNQKIWRISDILQWSKEFLKNKGVASPHVEAEWLLCHVLNLSRLQIYLNHNEIMDKKERDHFKKLLLQRASGTPLQYILGYTEFMGFHIKVSPDTLIPRMDTEVIVDQIYEHYNSQESLKIADLCTGSGCIAAALALHFPNSLITALDISLSALQVAKENFQYHKITDRIEVLHQDLLRDQNLNTSYDIIISNPPYISGEKYETLSPLVKDNEPFIALNPGADEFIFYRIIADMALKYLNNNGTLFAEIGGDYQVPNIKNIFIEKGLKNLEIIKDYNGLSRGIKATR